MLSIELSKNYTEDDIKVLARGLDANAAQKLGLEPVEPYAFFLRDEQSVIVGGCSGIMYYGCLYIDMLWIDDKYRGQDYGTQLVHSAEDMARANGCTFSTLETMSFEALDFYKLLGYSVQGIIDGYHKNVKMYLLRKEL